MANKRFISIIAIAAAVLAVIALILFIAGGGKGGVPEQTGNVPSSNEILMGLRFKGEVECDPVGLKNNVVSDVRFADYQLRDEYCMVFQITDEESKKTVSDFLCLKSELPENDYSSRFVILSVGRKIDSTSDRDKLYSDNGKKVLEITYAKEYYPDKVFVYTMKKTEFLSGMELELYYLEKVHPNANFAEGERDKSELIGNGSYHKLYRKSEGVYEYVLYLADGQTVASRRIVDSLPAIKERSETVVEVECNGSRFFYNPTVNYSSSATTYTTHYLTNDIVAYARLYNNELVLMVRNVYHTSEYGYYFKLPFTQDTANVNGLIKKVEVIDKTHILVEFYTGADKKLTTQVMVVPNLEA